MKSPSAAEDILLKQLGDAVSLCPLQHLKEHQLPAKLIADQEGSLPDELLSLLNHFCPLLLAPNRAVQITAYKVLLRYVLTKSMSKVTKIFFGFLFWIDNKC